MAYTCSIVDETGFLVPALTIAAMRGAAEAVQLLLEEGHLAAVCAAAVGKMIMLPLHAAAAVSGLAWCLCTVHR
jgi:hypothetical protein